MRCDAAFNELPQILLCSVEQLYIYDTFMATVSDDPVLPANFHCMIMADLIPYPLPVDILANMPLIPQYCYDGGFRPEVICIDTGPYEPYDMERRDIQPFLHRPASLR